ncbi:hypothetical protein KUTeg_006843 [Tegillarca granosa]|uniref:Sperm-associated antigen 17 n=1 Tax=Tegillarca granosa TaxID=220873 RepID=A0ABQ9FBH9_TEGGR|nr:hypothetical protein KUTeg_006843 [Tegillarca granosa]
MYIFGTYCNHILPGSITDSDLIDYSLPDSPSSSFDPVDLEAIPSTRPSRPNMASRPGKASILNSQSNLSVPNKADNTSRQSRSKKKKGKKIRSAASPTPLDRPASAPKEKEDEVKPSPSKEQPGSRPSTAESKKGILRASSRSSSPGVRPSRSRIHFEKDDQGHPVRHIENDDEEVIEPEPDKTTEESMNEIVDAQKRILDQWCFAEHYERNVLLQNIYVFKAAMYKLPFIDTYYNKRDHSLMVVLHNPHNQELQNHVDWHTELHSNLGFRFKTKNKFIVGAESISDFNKEEEAKYQAFLLTKELEKIQSDEAAAAKAAEKGRKSSGKKSPARGKSPKGSRSSSQERVQATGDNMFIRANSLKAWKDEQARLKAEEEEKEREKSAKRSKSAQKKDLLNLQSAINYAEKEEKEKKRGESRGSAKRKEYVLESADLNKFIFFTGYDVGNDLVHVSGITTTLFPSDGGQIRTERTEFVQGTTSVMSSVIKDGHTFTVHVIDPKEPSDDADDEEEEEAKIEVEKAEMEKSEKDEGGSTKDSVAGSSDRKSASLKSDSDKSKLSVSAFGSITATMLDGMTLALSQFGPGGESEDVYIPPPSTPMPHPPPSPSKSKKGDRKSAVQSEPPPAQPPVTDDEEKEEEKEEKKDEEKPVQQAFQQLYVTCPDGLNVKYFLESSIERGGGMKPITEDDRRLLVKQSYPFKTKGEQSCESQRKKYALTEVSRIMTSEGTVIKNMVDGNVDAIFKMIMVLYADGTVSIHTGKWPLPRSRSNSPNRAGSARSQTGKPEKPTKGSKGAVDKPPEEEEDNKKGSWVTTYPNGEKVSYKGDGTMEELKSAMICLASDPETNQVGSTAEARIKIMTMATRDDHVITISYPDGTTIVEHSDGTRITTYYRQSQVPANEDFEEGDTTDIKDFETQIVKFVKVECPAYATVEFNCSSSENLTIFGSGTTINVFPDGYYMLHHYEGGRVEVDTEGTVTYYPRPNKFLEQLLPDRDLQYVLRHNADIVVEMVDLDGNVFNVKYNGDFQVISSNGDALSESSLEEHAPRFFILHGDGSGTELLRYQNVAEYMNLAEQSPATAVLKDPLPDYPESIIPPGIRTRDLTTLPPKEYKTPGPKFGTNVGQGLSVGAAVRAPVRIPILKCPKVLELRQLVQYKPVIFSCFLYDKADIKDIYEKATSPPAPSPPPTPISKRTKADWERDQREMAMELEGRDALRNKKIPTYFDSEFGKAFLLSQAKDLDEMLQQLSEDPRKDGTEAVRGESSSQSDKQQISPVTTLAAVTSVQSDRSSTSPVETLHPKQVPDTPTSYAVYAETVPSRGGVRPGNPTPVHATGQGSPAPLRPHNPTPSHANKTGTGRPINPTPKQAGGTESPSDLPSQLDYPIIQEQPTLEEEDSTVEVADGEAEMIVTKSLKVNVIGEPRADPVPIPQGLKGGKPGAIPNTKYIKVEDPVRRKVNNSVVAGATIKGQTQLAQMRGIILLPDEVDFGVLKEGNRYAFSVFLKNTGVDSCRYKLRQPPPATGLRIVYKPGPIAAGMKAELEIELYAIAVGVEGDSGVGSITHAYDNRNPNHPQGGKSPGTRLVSTKPPSTTGIIRPRREPFQGSGVSTFVSKECIIRYRLVVADKAFVWIMIDKNIRNICKGSVYFMTR